MKKEFMLHNCANLNLEQLQNRVMYVWQWFFVVHHLRVAEYEKFKIENFTEEISYGTAKWYECSNKLINSQNIFTLCSNKLYSFL